ncbi:hypothetical protein G7B40_007115 [Aetokthonos hydrillicola Thurmond2011]|uniref:Uncharacterized protein n=1 Tax=Aetokthonos hydrillicola Thurmond2011 TaxID=2712845 RepID=A0AAP5I630_9CYAN|nr:hypothetical protein [Aetokthonos hydrillicola]MBO3459267.1 hypothetical protein [Aetokthonos hydrillicola CCALA 1050]MBW4590577.1 hypothetical protein [Aetokthonos hydrillicola CCALA 1050]MDR9894342.1 hypothetical protein [Aetokthonos hydrillicola Thurmond2011]
MQDQFKFNTSSVLKLTLVTLALSLLVGGYAKANAEPAQKDEVLSVPPQEAFYIQEKTQPVSQTSDKNTLTNRAVITRASNNLKNGNGQNLAPVKECVSSTVHGK